MKLWYSPASPFVRKVLITAHETGQAGDIEIVEVSTTVVARDTGLVLDNPLGKLPTLVLADGTVLFDSSVICAYLDSRHSGAKLLPASGAGRFAVMTLEALGDGMMDAAVAARYEVALRPAERQWPEWRNGLMAKVEAALDALEARWMPTLEGPLNCGAIAVAAGLGYLDFRYGDLGWRKTRPGLAAWYAAFEQRPSMQATKP